MKSLIIILTCTLLISCQSTQSPIKPIPNLIKSENDNRPIVTVPPKYPHAAFKSNQEGWVQLKFDINNDGKVINLKVVDFSPEGYGFENEALRAVEKWKYEPNQIIKNELVTIEFRINK